MIKIKKYLCAFGILAISPLVLSPEMTEAGCNCQNGGQVSSGFVIEGGSPFMDNGASGAYTSSRAYHGQVMSGVPPKGNLGVAYRRPTRLVQWDEHPRAAGLEIALPPSVTRGVVKEGEGLQLRITVQDHRNYYEPVEGYIGDDDRWHFLTDPLIPGSPHIFDVLVELVQVKKVTERRWGRNYERQIEEKVRTVGHRTVRLIRGRVTELSF